MTRRPLPLRFEPFVAKLEQASEEGRADFIAANMPRLEELIRQCMDWQVEIAGSVLLTQQDGHKDTQ